MKSEHIFDYADGGIEDDIFDCPEPPKPKKSKHGSKIAAILLLSVVGAAVIAFGVVQIIDSTDRTVRPDEDSASTKTLESTSTSEDSAADGGGASDTAAGAIIEKYTIDGYTYEIEEGDTLTLLHSRHPTSSYYAYTWYVTEGEDLVTIEPAQGTCRVYSKGGTGTVTLQGNLDYTVLLGTSAENYSYEYEMYIHISARSADGSKSELKEWQTCSTCSGSGYITLSGKQKTCPTCAGMGQILR